MPAAEPVPQPLGAAVRCEPLVVVIVDEEGAEYELPLLGDEDLAGWRTDA